MHWESTCPSRQDVTGEGEGMAPAMGFDSCFAVQDTQHPDASCGLILLGPLGTVLVYLLWAWQAVCKQYRAPDPQVSFLDGSGTF